MNKIELWQGDCLELMKSIPDNSIDCVLTDPPYGTTACKWDTVIDLDLMWKELKRIIKDNGTIVLFGGQPFTSVLITSNLKMYRYNWVWEKNKSANFAQAPYMPLKNIEDIIVFSKATIAANSKNRMIYNPQGTKEINKICSGNSASDFRPNRKHQRPYRQTRTGYPRQILKFNNEGKTIHPTQKPVALMEYLIKTYTDEYETVLDFTMGSGTTGVACKNLNRKFIGIELDEKYFEIAKERINGIDNVI